MQKFIVVFFIFFIAFFTGCSEKTTALKYFEKDPQSALAIQYTKKRDILYKNEQKVMLFTTYLNKINKNYKNEDLNSFIVAIHIINEEGTDPLEEGSKISLNGKKPISIEKIKSDSPLIKKIPLKNNWANYYLVTFKNDKNIYKLNIKFTHPVYGQTNLNFDK